MFGGSQLKKLLSIFFDVSFLKFLLVGVCNTILSMAIMYLLYITFEFGYWGSSAIAFTLVSIFSYVFNRKFSFKSKAPILQSVLRFSLVIAVCYMIAFGIAKPIMLWFVAMAELEWNISVVEKISMLLAQCIFTGLNFLGQRLWVFKGEKKDEETTNHHSTYVQ